MSKVAHTVVDDDYPNLFRKADWESQQEQKSAVRSLWRDMVFTILGTCSVIIAEAINFYRKEFMDQFPEWIPEGIEKLFWLVGAGSLIYCTRLTFSIKNKDHEKGWYNGRAIAETVKTLSWRYMTHSLPCDLEKDERDNFMEEASVEKEFRGLLSNVLKNFKEISVKLAGEGLLEDPVTTRMRKVRQASFDVRLQTYMKHRLENQHTWYKKKSKSNKKWEDGLLKVVIVFKFLTLVFAMGVFYGYVYQVSNVSILLSVASMCAACALAFLGWSQFRQYEEFAQAYSIAANDLAELIQTAEEFRPDRKLRNEEDFPRFVLNAEKAISREHTLWLGRRDKTYYPDKSDVIEVYRKDGSK